MCGKTCLQRKWPVGNAKEIDESLLQAVGLKTNLT